MEKSERAGEQLLKRFDTAVAQSADKAHCFVEIGDNGAIYGVEYKNFLGKATSLTHEKTETGDLISFDFVNERGKKRHHRFQTGDGKVFPFNEIIVATERAERGLFEWKDIDIFVFSW